MGTKEKGDMEGRIWTGGQRGHHSHLYTQVCYANVLGEYLEWDVLVFIEEHVELTDADPEVSISELVGDVESKGSKLPSLQCDAMEDTK